MEKCQEKQRVLHMVFIDLEKAYDRVPRQEVWRGLREREVQENYVRMIQECYKDVATRVKEHKSRGMRISRSKTEYFTTDIDGDQLATIKLGGEKLKRVRTFKYLGSLVEETAGMDKEINFRIQSGWNNWRKVSGVLSDRRVPIRLKGKVHKAVVRPALTYGLEAAPLKKGFRAPPVARTRRLGPGDAPGTGRSNALEVEEKLVKSELLERKVMKIHRLQNQNTEALTSHARPCDHRSPAFGNSGGLVMRYAALVMNSQS
ncbi:uncharacterized protein LOC119596258 [Penaeus monodon]|uniref:uncharacterized protein LOC119596258 n=1 Tax=Penaeus monodon TaxID=6687 RepID=UPI0018A73D70|nr:uncharacterized protein LOC119596258 [Penaeus monodon]